MNLETAAVSVILLEYLNQMFLAGNHLPTFLHVNPNIPFMKATVRLQQESLECMADPSLN